MDRIAAAQQPKQFKGAGWFVRKRTLQHEYRAVSSQLLDLAGEGGQCRRVGLEGMIGGVASDDGGLGAASDRFFDSMRKAGVDFGQGGICIVQIGKMCDAHGYCSCFDVARDRFSEAGVSAASSRALTLSANPSGSFWKRSSSASTRWRPPGLRLQPVPHWRSA